MQKFIKYFYFTCTPFLEDLICHLLSMVMQFFLFREDTVPYNIFFSMSENLGGWGEGVTWGKCGTGVQASISKPTPLTKIDPFMYLTYSYTAL